MNSIDVTTVTRNATMDDLSIAQYREIFEELRNDGSLKARVAAATGKTPNPDQPLSYDNWIVATGSKFSKALWQKYATGELDAPNREMRNELRALVNLPLLPPTIAEAISVASPDAEVLRIGHEIPDRLIMVGVPEETSLMIHANGTVTAMIEAEKETRNRSYTPPAVGRIKVKRELFDKLNNRRVALGLSWEELMSKLESMIGE